MSDFDYLSERHLMLLKIKLDGYIEAAIWNVYQTSP